MRLDDCEGRPNGLPSARALRPIDSPAFHRLDNRGFRGGVDARGAAGAIGSACILHVPAVGTGWNPPYSYGMSVSCRRRGVPGGLRSVPAYSHLAAMRSVGSLRRVGGFGAVVVWWRRYSSVGVVRESLPLRSRSVCRAIRIARIAPAGGGLASRRDGRLLLAAGGEVEESQILRYGLEPDGSPSRPW